MRRKKIAQSASLLPTLKPPVFPMPARSIETDDRKTRILYIDTHIHGFYCLFPDRSSCRPPRRTAKEIARPAPIGTVEPWGMDHENMDVRHRSLLDVLRHVRLPTIDGADTPRQ